jgi:hypothetical protein
VARSLTLAVISSSPSPLLLLDGEFAADVVRAVALHVHHFESSVHVSEEDDVIAEGGASDSLQKLRARPAHLAGQAGEVVTVIPQPPHVTASDRQAGASLGDMGEDIDQIPLSSPSETQGSHII